MNISSVLDDNWGMWHHLYFYSGYFDYRGTFQTVLDFYCYVTGVNIAVLDTVLSDIIEAHGTITTECVGSPVSQYYYLQKS